MVEKKKSKYLTKKERDYTNALAKFNTIKAAAGDLGIEAQTLYNWKSELKKRYRKKRGWINAILAQTRRGGCLKNLLKARRQMELPDTEEDEDE